MEILNKKLGIVSCNPISLKGNDFFCKQCKQNICEFHIIIVSRPHQRFTEKSGELGDGAQREIMLTAEPFGYFAWTFAEFLG